MRSSPNHWRIRPSLWFGSVSQTYSRTAAGRRHNLLNRGFPITAWNGQGHSNSKFSIHPDHHTPPWQYLAASNEEKCEHDYCGELEKNNHLEDLGEAVFKRIILKLNKPDKDSWIGLIWLLWTLQWAFGLDTKAGSFLSSRRTIRFKIPLFCVTAPWTDHSASQVSSWAKSWSQLHQLVPELGVKPSLTSHEKPVTWQCTYIYSKQSPYLVNY